MKPPSFQERRQENASIDAIRLALANIARTHGLTLFARDTCSTAGHLAMDIASVGEALDAQAKDARLGLSLHRIAAAFGQSDETFDWYADRLATMADHFEDNPPAQITRSRAWVEPPGVADGLAESLIEMVTVKPCGAAAPDAVEAATFLQRSGKPAAEAEEWAEGVRSRARREAIMDVVCQLEASGYTRAVEEIVKRFPEVE